MDTNSGNKRNGQFFTPYHVSQIDVTCCYMTFIQTSLLGLTGEVIHGNTITLESWNGFITPMTILNLGNYKKFKNPNKITA